MANGDRAGPADPDGAPQAHVLVRRHGIPVHKGDGQVARARRENLQGQSIWLSRMRRGGDVQFVRAVGAGDFVRGGNALAVQPHVGAVIHPVQVEPGAVVGSAPRQRELHAIPPRHAKRAVLRHLAVRKVGADGIARAGYLPQILAKGGVGIDAVFDQARQHRLRPRHPVPPRRAIAGEGNGLPAIRDPRRGLHLPAGFDWRGRELRSVIA